MLKSLMGRIGAALGLTLLLGSVPAEARAPQPAHPALWEVTDPDTTIYLFGTIHVLPEDLKWRTAAFDSAVAKSQELVVETKIDPQNLQSVRNAELQLGFGKNPPPIAQRVAPGKLPLLRTAITDSGVPEAMLNQMDTWLAAITFLAVQLKELGLANLRGPEEILRQQFLSANKPIGELETNVEQFGYFERLPERAQRDLLEGSIEPLAAARQEYNQMLGPWSRGDVKGISATFNQDLAGSPALRNNLLEQRNANWAKWIEQRMGQPGTIFVAVGAGHLAGKDSVIARLQSDGYKVTRLQ